MDVSGTSHEGWMMFVPLTVLVPDRHVCARRPGGVHEHREQLGDGRRRRDRPLAKATVTVTGRRAS